MVKGGGKPANGEGLLYIRGEGRNSQFCFPPSRGLHLGTAGPGGPGGPGGTTWAAGLQGVTQLQPRTPGGPGGAGGSILYMLLSTSDKHYKTGLTHLKCC